MVDFELDYLYSQAGLEVMLSVPRQANDEMSISHIRGYEVSLQ